MECHLNIFFFIIWLISFHQKLSYILPVDFFLPSFLLKGDCHQLGWPCGATPGMVRGHQAKAFVGAVAGERDETSDRPLLRCSSH